jgi:flagellar biogenesis protein FliO
MNAKLIGLFQVQFVGHNYCLLNVIVLCLLAAPIQLAAQQDSSATRWPRSKLTVDQEIQQVDYEFESLETSRPNSLAAGDAKHAENRLTPNPISDDSVANAKTAATRWYSTLTSNLSTANVPKIVGSLAFVLGGYFGFVWLIRRLNPAASMGLPQEVVEVLGQTPFGNRKHLQLVRLGSKLLLLTNGADGIQSIGEINDPNEVDYLASLCGGKRHGRSAIAIGKATANNSRTSSEIRQILRQLKSSTNASPDSVFEA